MSPSNGLEGDAQTMRMSAPGRVHPGQCSPAAATTDDSISIDISGSDCGSRTSASSSCATADFHCWSSVGALCHLHCIKRLSWGTERVVGSTLLLDGGWYTIVEVFPAFGFPGDRSCQRALHGRGRWIFVRVVSAARAGQCNGISGWRLEDVAVQRYLKEIGAMDDLIICKEQLNDKQFLIYLITILTFSWVLFKWHSASSRKFIKSVLQARIVIFPPLDCSTQSV